MTNFHVKIPPHLHDPLSFCVSLHVIVLFTGHENTKVTSKEKCQLVAALAVPVTVLP